jgi:predicted transglutaminase-like cysteine proteinase
VIAEIIPEAYDALGRKVLRPDLRRKGVHPTFPVGRYVSQPLTVTCESILDIRKFLATCKAVSDKEQFGTEDYWQPPEHFEQTKKGDCDDFSLWNWRQFLALGYDARFVWGRHGR